MNDSSNPLTWITTYVILLLLILFGSDARSAPLHEKSAQGAFQSFLLDVDGNNVEAVCMLK